MATHEIPFCPTCKQAMKKLSENSTHAMWACGGCGKGHQLAK